MTRILNLREEEIESIKTSDNTELSVLGKSFRDYEQTVFQD